MEDGGRGFDNFVFSLQYGIYAQFINFKALPCFTFIKIVTQAMYSNYKKFSDLKKIVISNLLSCVLSKIWRKLFGKNRSKDFNPKDDICNSRCSFR